MRPYPLSAAALVDDIVTHLNQVEATVEKRFSSLSDEQLAWRPQEKRWGVGHCLVHLARTNELYREALVQAFRNGPKGGGEDALTGRITGRLFTWLVGPSVPVKVRAPDVIKPRQRTVSTGAVEAFLVEQHRLKGVAEEGASLDLDAVVVRSPIASWMKLTGGDALRVVVAHELRHLKQAEAVLDDGRFPH